ncbi:MAG: hypothetical protein ACOCSD_06930 [Halolamina sp.]
MPVDDHSASKMGDGCDDDSRDDGSGELAAAAREHLLSTHRTTLTATLDAADAVAADWAHLDDGRLATPDREAVVDPLRAELGRRDLFEEYLRTLAGAVEAAGARLPASPVTKPPYVVVTSTGPVLRGTVDDGRFVVRVNCFEVVREPSGITAPVAYARTADSPAAALSVSFEPSPANPGSGGSAR